jgi:hypothetical protein
MDENEVQSELRRIRRMALPANRAKSFARLLWRLRRFPMGAWNTWEDVWKLEALYRRLKDNTYNRRQRWWRGKNLPKEIAKAKEGKGFVAELTEFFRTAKKKV